MSTKTNSKKESQEQKSALTREIATTDRNWLQPVYGGILRSQDAVLISRGGGRGLAIYDDIERDCHAYAVLQKRKMAVIAREWRIEPASDAPLDRKAAELVERQLKAVRIDRICYGLLDAILKGFAVGEIIWERRQGEIAVKDVKMRDQRRFVFGADGTLRLLTLDNMLDGKPLPDRKFIVSRFGDKNDDPYGLGLGTRLFWPVFFKRQGITFWLTFTDKFGNPTAVGKYPPSSSPAEVQKLLSVLSALASDTGVAIPEGMDIDLLEAQRSGSVNSHETLCRYMDEQISEAVLGETLTTNIGPTGSRAASATHNEVREELTKADADLQCDDLMQTLIRWIVELNLPNATPPRFWRDFEEAEDLNALADRDHKLAEIGFIPTPERVRAVYGDGYVQKAPDANQPTKTEPPATAFADPPAAPPRDAVDDLADQLVSLSAPMVDDMLADIRRVVETSTSFDEISARLAILMPGRRPNDLENILADAMTTADLQGRVEITGDA